MSLNNNQGDNFEIIERDSTARKIGTWKFDCSNFKLANGIIGYIINKYGFKPLINKPKDDFLNMDMNL